MTLWHYISAGLGSAIGFAARPYVARLLAWLSANVKTGGVE